MNSEDKILIQESWKQVVPIAHDAADQFYEKLFELDPAVEAFFQATDMNAQKSKLITTLSSAVAGLDDIKSLNALLSDLGRRHADYGVSESHYETVGRALLLTLEVGLGKAGSQPVLDAWSRLYAHVAEQMKKGAGSICNSKSTQQA